MPQNPFSYGKALSPNHFIGRSKEIRRIVNRLLNGESTALIGDPHIGKTSLLTYLVHSDTRQSLYEGKAAQWYFSMMDTQILGGQLTPVQFWEQALFPIKESLDKEPPDSPLNKHYALCKDNNFGNFTLERLFLLLKKIGRQFVLALDEFDTLLNHPVLNSAEFYGGLRSFASRPEFALVLIIASRTPLSQLNSRTQKFNPTGSPFFNIFAEITMGALTDKEVEKLFSLAGDRFKDHEKHAIKALAGKHPYLLQATCAALWDAYEEDEINRQPYVVQRLQEVNFFFSDTWRTWTPEIRKAFTIAAIAHQERLLKDAGFFGENLMTSIEDWKPELRELENKGWIEKDEQYQGGYKISSEIMLAWLSDELIKAARTDKSFESWLQERGIDGAFISVDEKKAFVEAAKKAAGVIKQAKEPIKDIFDLVKGLLGAS